MMTCEYDGDPFLEPRSHPWTRSSLDQAAHYCDFTAEPALIRTELEDFTPFGEYAAIQDFYALLERINQPTSPLESNDCAFQGPAPNDSARNKASHGCSGRLMLLFRALEQNTLKARVIWLKMALHYELNHLDPKFVLGIVGTTLVPVRYLVLEPKAQLGQQLMVSFWAFGDSEALAMHNLARLLRNLSRALRGVSSRILQGG